MNININQSVLEHLSVHKSILLLGKDSHLALVIAPAGAIMLNFRQVFLKVSLYQLSMLLVLFCMGQFVDGVQVCVCLLELVLGLVVGFLFD